MSLFFLICLLLVSSSWSDSPESDSLDGLTKMIMNWIPLNSLMICCLMMMVVVLVKLVVESGQVPFEGLLVPSYFLYSLS